MRWLLTIALLWSLQPQATDNGSPLVYQIRVEGSISPATSSYIQRSVAIANEEGVEALILQLDTPGGLLNSTKEIVQSFLGSNVPIIVYVAPRGASAGSAGVFITLSAHIAAMAPATNIGAAHPVQMGGASVDSVMGEKITNYAESYIETIAKERNRNVEWARSAVRSSASITAEQALEINVIDVIADNRDDLMNKVDGRIINGDTLQTRDARIEEMEPTLAEKLLRYLFQPEIMFILMLVAIYGLIGEISNPGAIFPGVTGAIALILLLYTISVIPINIAGFALIGLALVLFVAEAFTPTFGLLTIGGAVTFFLGSLLLFQDLPSGFRLSWGWLIPFTILTALFFAFVVSAGLRSQFSGVKSGSNIMVGQVAEVVQPINQNSGKVFFDGEYWNARSSNPIQQGEHCRIERVEGLLLHVQPLSNSDNGGLS